MKLAFISDIHGNAIALEAVLNDLNRKEVDKVYVLGDLCFRGPDPQRSVDLVKSLNTEVIKGNADEWVVRGIKEGEVPGSAFEMMSTEREWTFSKLDSESIKYLKNLPEDLMINMENVKIHAFHATPNSLFEVVSPNVQDQVAEEKMMDKNVDIYIYAHIHKPYIRFLNGKCIINTGSVGMPFDGIVKSSYALVEVNQGGFQTSIVRVDYDFLKVIQQFEESSYPNVDQMVKIIKNAAV